MQVVIDDSVTKDFAALSNELVLLNDKAPRPLTATVMTKAEASRADDRRKMWDVGLTLAGVAIGCVLFVRPDESGWWISLVAMITVAAIVVGYSLWQRKKFQSRLDQRLRALPPPGTDIRLDEQSLTVGGRPFPLAELRLDALNVRTESRGSGSSARTVYELDRLSLTAPAGPLVLDALFMTEGQVFVDNIYRRLGPPRSAAG